MSTKYNSVDAQPKAIETYFTTTMTKTVNGKEPIELVEKYTKPEERQLTMQGKSTIPKICGWKSFVKNKHAQLSSLELVACDKSDHISGVDTSRFAHKTTAQCALNVKQDVPTPKSQTLHLVPC